MKNNNSKMLFIKFELALSIDSDKMRHKLTRLWVTTERVIKSLKLVTQINYLNTGFINRKRVRVLL